MKAEDVQEILEQNLAAGTTGLPEELAKSIFAAYGIPVVSERVTSKSSECGRLAAETGFPVVLKGSGSGILHKTEAGMVRVGLTSEEEVVTAAEEMRRAGGPALESFLIQPMIKGSRELVAGIFRDPLFGPVILFGLGGIFTEVLNDTAIRLAPLSDGDIDSMLTEVKAERLLGPFRGEQPANRAILKTILRALSDIAITHPTIKEVDINPIIIAPSGRPIAVDGLITLEQPVDAPREHSPVDTAAFRACFYPKSIAFVGASATVAKWGHSLVTNILSQDYTGDLHLVNPRGGTLMGRKVFRSVDEIQADVDLAVVTIPAAGVPELIPQLAAKGVRAMLLITSGFRETGEEGALLEDALVEAARQAKILIFGPNTMGICNPHINFFCSGVHVYPRPGSTVLVCQSGNMGTQLLAFAEQQDIGIRAFSGSGNEAMVTIEDYMEVFEDDEQTGTVVLYVESIKDGRRFFDCARKVSKKKPVVILKGGRTNAGSRAAASHTGAIASDFRVFQAACRQAGIVEVAQPMELLDLSAVFSSQPLPRGNRVAIMTLGGGWGVITTDLCLENGLAIPELPDAIIERLNTILPPYWSHANPVDIVGERDPNIPRVSIEELMQWDGCDAVIHLGIHGRRILAARMLDSVSKSDPNNPPPITEQMKAMIARLEADYIHHVARLSEKYEKPVLGVSLLTDEETKTLYRFDDCRYQSVFFPTPERAVRALAGMCRYRQWLEENR